MKDIKILMILAHLWDMNKYTVKKKQKNQLLAWNLYEELDVQRKYVYAKLVVYQYSSVSIWGGGATGSEVTGSDMTGSDHDRKSRKWSRAHAQSFPAFLFLL